jgi:hypothetical protein
MLPVGRRHPARGDAHGLMDDLLTSRVRVTPLLKTTATP